MEHTGFKEVGSWFGDIGDAGPQVSPDALESEIGLNKILGALNLGSAALKYAGLP